MKKDKIDYVVSIDEEAPLFDCIFTAGLYHDRTTDEYVPFTRDCFPEEASVLILRGKSLLELWVTTFLPDWQQPLIFVRFISNFLCMFSNSMASAHVILK